MVLKLAPAMATPLRPVRRRRLVALLGGGLLCVLAVSAGIGLVLGARAPSPSKAASVAAASRAAVKGTAPLMNSTQWSHLQASLANEPDRDAQTARIVELLAFQRTVEAFRGRHATSADDPALPVLAQRIDRGLPERIARREIGGPEALRLKAAVLEVLEPDFTRRTQVLAEWRDAQLRAHPPAADPRDAQLLAAQRVLVARWRAESPPGAPPDGLLAELEALRQRIYDDQAQGDKP